METADMVKVAVSAAPYSIDKPYSYLVPESLAAAAVPGVRVMVPFGRGNKESEGLILARVQEPKLPGSKAIRQILDSEPVLDKAGIDLALWMRGRYFCTVFEAVKTILPAGLWYGLREIWSLAMEPETARSAAVGIPGAWQVLDLLEKQGGKADIRVLRDALGDGAEKPLKAMKKAEILTCETDAKRKIADKSHRMVELAVNTEDAYALTEPKRRSAPARYEVVNFLATAGRTPAAEVSYYTGASSRTLKTMEKAGLIAFSEEEELRVPSLDDVEPGPEIVLNEEQQRAFEEILGRVQAAKPSVTLLRGVTGSGKTQVYLRLVQETLALGKTAMVLVPEIVLTPQMMRKFSSYFGSRVAMLHSSLKMTERYDQWKRIRRGEVDVVLGTRSALFAPLKNLGLIIMDEEQEGSYQATATLWVLGNYSRFIRPGYRRIALDLNESRTFFGSAWLSPEGDKVVAVYTNMSDKAVRLGETHVGWSNEAKSIATYTTTGSKNLVEGTVAAGKQVILEAKSVTTVVYSLK